MLIKASRIRGALRCTPVCDLPVVFQHASRYQALSNSRILVSRTMATGSRVQFDASQKPQYYVKGLTAESAEKTSQLLQVNHEKHHIFFNQSGFHVRLSSNSEEGLVTNRRLRTTSHITCALSMRSTQPQLRFSTATMPMSRISAHQNR